MSSTQDARTAYDLMDTFKSLYPGHVFGIEAHHFRSDLWFVSANPSGSEVYALETTPTEVDGREFTVLWRFSIKPESNRIAAYAEASEEIPPNTTIDDLPHAPRSYSYSRVGEVSPTAFYL